MFSATWPHLGELQDAGSVGLVARGEFIRVNASLHALFICDRFFLFLGTAPTNVIDCFTGFNLSQAAISLEFTPFVFLKHARKEDVLYLNQAERSPFFFHSPDRRSARHFCFSVDFSDEQISASSRSKPGT